MLRQGEKTVKANCLLKAGFICYGRMLYKEISVTVKLILRGKEYEVKPGMTLLSALNRCNIVPESIIATRDGEMILDDEILKDGDVVRLVAVISGGSDIREKILDTCNLVCNSRFSNIE